jgi:hypothetical protein
VSRRCFITIRNISWADIETNRWEASGDIGGIVGIETQVEGRIGTVGGCCSTTRPGLFHTSVACAYHSWTERFDDVRFKSCSKWL